MIDKKYIQVILCSFWVWISCSRQEIPQVDTFQPQLLTICVEDLGKSVEWYTQKLDFEVEKQIEEYPDYGLKLAFLRAGEFHLELIENKNSYRGSAILPPGEQYIGGGFKIGFQVKDLQETYDQIQTKADVEFITGIGDLTKPSLPMTWPSRHFLIKDLDGNYLQFFDGGEQNEMSPWLLMITVENLESSIAWYVKQLGFQHHQTLGEKGNKRAILERNGYVVELFEPEHVRMARDLPADSMVLGYNKIAFGVGDIQAASSNFHTDSTEVVLPIEESDFDWASKAMIVKDPEGNWTQLFEIN